MGESLDSRFFEEMVEAVGVGIAIYGDDGRFIYVNDAYANLFDVTVETLTGVSVWDVATEFEAERFDEYWASFAESETRTAETTQEFNGVRVPVATVTTRRRIDGTPYHFGTITDISERKQRERDLQRQNERLDSFAGVVSHDLRNPLNVAQGYLDIIKEDVDGDEVALIESALDRMEILITDLLTLARGGDDIDDLAPVDLGAAATDAWDSVETGSATLDSEESTDATVTADRRRLQQLLENLFRNAIEHGGEDVTVTVGVCADRSGFFVADTGPGIDPDMTEELFEPGRTTKSDGTGFGLAIASEIAQAHGWEISATESESGGARFEFSGVSFS
ncbi:sensor histidine kinase [Halobaculum sp. EA56]|uniref:sensor histidine kinase n=1 Tax=Halobaculum sp. EA56 TaxID=3421648 RepID=UPI003EBC3DF3